MYKFARTVKAYADEKMLSNSTSAKLWKSFSFNCSELEMEKGEENTFLVGSTPIPTLEDNSEYAISVTETGIAVRGRDYNSLLRGFSVLCLKIDYTDLHKGKEALFVPLTEFSGRYKISNRMIHFCIFPETDYEYIRKYIRLAGIMQYTHVIIEFWGMLRYDCLKELAWENAFTKDKARALVKEARDFGMEPIPMFNQLGHATASRLCAGKHVVLDRNPSLQYLFTPDGWSWDIESDEVFELLKKIRLELCEVFGEGEYFHVGCDEAYMYSKSEEKRSKLPGYLKKLTDEVAKEGRRPMVWMDMMIPKLDEGYTAFSRQGESEKLIASLNPATVAVDWQYHVKEAPIKTTEYLADKGLDVMGAPWYDDANIIAHINTISENKLFGIMETTWHTLNDKLPSVISCAKLCGAVSFDWSIVSGYREEAATLLRKISFEKPSYEYCGWTKQQIGL